MLEVQGISKRYGSIEALSDVSLAVGRGEIVAVVGENGAGKSTLVCCIARALLPDRGSVTVDGVRVGSKPRDAIDLGISVVWQDLALCGNLDVTANLFLGRELDRLGTLHSAAMAEEANRVLGDLGVTLPGLDWPIDRLSGGQRQLVAIARAMLDEPRVLVLDEPTASLGVREGQAVLDVLTTLRSRGVGVLLVSHRLDAVFDVSDRIVVLRHGRNVADLHRAETHPDDVVALLSGADVDTTAGQQLRRLHSLAEQLADADQSAILPLTVSSLSSALSTDRLAIYLVEGSGDDRVLRRSASLHLPASLAADLELLPVDGSTFVGTAAVEGSLVVVPRLEVQADDRVSRVASTHGLGGAWAAPIVGQTGPIAVMVGFHVGVSPLQEDQTRLLELFSTMAGAAIERGRLVETLRRRNKALEGLRGVLETLAGPDLLASGFEPAIDALCGGVGSDVAALYVAEDTAWSPRAVSSGLVSGHEAELHLRHCVDEDPSSDPAVLTTAFDWSRGRAALACRWSGPAPPDAGVLVEDAANSFRLAMEREITLEVERESAAIRHRRELERELTLRLGHELRTPLTAIRGFASTLLQPDVVWPDTDKERFLQIIEQEAGRMSRLVAELFDDTAIESGALRLECNYCDLVAILTAAASIAAPAGAVVQSLPPSCTVWGDRDRLEQVFVNLIANAVRHNGPETRVTVRVEPGDGRPEEVRVEISDDGVGMPADAVAFLNGESVDRPRDRGLGLRLVRGLVAAHQGSVLAEVDGGTSVTVTLPIDEPADAR